MLARRKCAGVGRLGRDLEEVAAGHTGKDLGKLRGLAARERQDDALFGEHGVHRVHGVFRLAEADVRRAVVDGLLDLLRLHAARERRGGVALDLVHRLIRRRHDQNDQLAQSGAELFLRVNLAVDEPLLDGGKLGVGDAECGRSAVQRLCGLFRLFCSVHCNAS